MTKPGAKAKHKAKPKARAQAEPLAVTQVLPSSADGVSWSAPEYTPREKPANWYVWIVIASLALGALVYVIVKDIISVVVVALAAVMFGVYGSREPRKIDYRLDHQGLAIGPRIYSYEEFRSFSVNPPENGLSSLEFMPLKRFALATTIYYAPDDEERIISFLTSLLPYDQKRRDPIDRLMRRLRF